MDRYIVISSDCHAGADLLDYKPYLESRFHDDFDRWAAAFVNPFGDLERPDADRNWDSARRTADLEADGVVAEVVYPNTVPPFFPSGNLVATSPTADDFAHRLAGLRAHNRWMAEWCAEQPERRAGIGQLLLNDVDEAVRDVHWIADHGLRGGVLLPGIPPGSTDPAAARPRLRPGVAGLRGAGPRGQRPRRRRVARLRAVPGLAVDVAHGGGLVLPPAAVVVRAVGRVRPLPRPAAGAGRAGPRLAARRPRHDGHVLRPDRRRERGRAGLRRAVPARPHAERVLGDELRGRRVVPPPRRLRAA